MHGLFLHCRPGFETECAAEIQAQAAALGVAGYCKAKPAAAYVVFVTATAQEATHVHQTLQFDQLIFARQWFQVTALCNQLDPHDRISGLLAALENVTACDDLFLETVDTNAGKELQALCRKLDKPLTVALRKHHLLHGPARDHGQRLHICFLATQAAYLGIAAIDNSSRHRMGIPRLRFPRGAPSRSALKLEEALLTFLNEEQRARLLQPDMTAVDLGAAPGGWTWQLVDRGLTVQAIDNGALTPALLEGGRVEHRREDGFRFRPDEAVDWMVCDIVEQPARIADLAGRWLSEGDCRHSIFNLKLPMKKRYQEVQQCLDRLRTRLEAGGRPYRLACKQLYHDREEVTVYVGLQ